MHELLDVFTPRVSKPMNELLEKIAVEELKKTLFDIASSNASGAHGFTIGLYQSH